MIDISSINNVTISDTGYWTSSIDIGHIFDHKLADGISELCKGKNTFWDLGCGPGLYVDHLNNCGYCGIGIDGNPNTPEGNIIMDLSKPQIIPKKDFSISLEVGEHVPPEYENIFLLNLTNSSNMLILSWANKAQVGSGHVNPKNNLEVINKLASYGYNVDIEKSAFLRNCCEQWYFKKTILVFHST